MRQNMPCNVRFPDMAGQAGDEGETGGTGGRGSGERTCRQRQQAVKVCAMRCEGPWPSESSRLCWWARAGEGAGPGMWCWSSWGSGGRWNWWLNCWFGCGCCGGGRGIMEPSPCRKMAVASMWCSRRADATPFVARFSVLALCCFLVAQMALSRCGWVERAGVER